MTWTFIGNTLKGNRGEVDMESVMPDEIRISEWTKATGPTPELLTLILLLVGEWIQLSGRLPTVAELSRAIRHQGS